MTRKPWFRKNGSGGWFLPAAPEGWAILAGFIAAVLGTVWLPSSIGTPVRVVCGLVYLLVSYCFSESRIPGDPNG